MDNISHWDLKKKYFAANFYLIEKKPLSITDAQRSQLGTLHLYILFGDFSEEIEFRFLHKCSVSERKKRVLQWKKLCCYSKTAAMNKFIDLIDNLFPNWKKNREIIAKFESQWQKIFYNEGLAEFDKNPPTIFDHEFEKIRDLEKNSIEIKPGKLKNLDKPIEISNKRLNIEFAPAKPFEDYRMVRKPKQHQYFRRRSEATEKLPALYKKQDLYSPRNLSKSLIVDQCFKSPTNTKISQGKSEEMMENLEFRMTSAPKFSIFEEKDSKKFTVFSRLGVHFKDRYTLRY